jgi:hypothetical protein
MKYGIDFRYLPKGADKPLDNTTNRRPVDFEVDDNGFAAIPNVGDYVDYPQHESDIRDIDLRGKVRSRLFRYVMGYCYVTIVVEDTADDWTKISP